MPFLAIAKVLWRALIRKPETRLYPVEQRAPHPATRGHVDIDIGTCTLCTLCQKKCPTGAIAVDRPGRTWAIDRLRCIQCGACVDACAKDSIAMKPAYTAPATEKSIETVAKPPDPPKPPKPDAPAGEGA